MRPTRAPPASRAKKDSRPLETLAATLAQLPSALPVEPPPPSSRQEGTFTTGLGAWCRVKLDVFEAADAGKAAYELTVGYEDRPGYFGDAQQVLAWFQLHGADGVGPVIADDLTLERQPDGTFVGTARLVQQAGLTAADFAFVAGGKWDSNLGNNYHLPL